MDNKLNSAVPRLPRRALQRMLALFGLAALAGAPLAAQATVDAERAALDARVAQVRAALHGAAPDSPNGGPVDATPSWANWPNWGNWNNWPNWGKWFNTR